MEYFAHPTAVVDEPCQIGKGTKIWHFSHIMQNAQIGDNCNLGQNVVISPEVVLGHRCKVQNNVSLYTGLHCADEVFIGPSAVFTNILNPRAAVNRRDEYIPTSIGHGATIGANATLICGNDIGKFAFIGAGAVITKAVPAYALVVGNPARPIGWMSEMGYRLEFNTEGQAQCPGNGDRYLLEENRVRKVK